MWSLIPRDYLCNSGHVKLGRAIMIDNCGHACLFRIEGPENSSNWNVATYVRDVPNPAPYTTSKIQLGIQHPDLSE
jgi:hypothetical protein